MFWPNAESISSIDLSDLYIPVIPYPFLWKAKPFNRPKVGGPTVPADVPAVRLIVLTDLKQGVIQSVQTNKSNLVRNTCCQYFLLKSFIVLLNDCVHVSIYSYLFPKLQN